MSLTYLKSQASFHRFAGLIGQALCQFPRPQPLPGKPTAVAQPLRYALKAKAEHGYLHPLIDERLWRDHHDKLKVWERNGVAYLGPLPDKNFHVPVKPAFETYAIKSIEGVIAACKLIGGGHIVPMPCFLVHKVSQGFRHELSNKYGVHFEPVDGQDEVYQII